MSPPKFFIEPNDISGLEITIQGEDVSHISRVLRMRQGDELILSDGSGTEYSVRISAIASGKIITAITDRINRPLPSLHITLCQGLPKSDKKMDLIVQKATELGVSSIIPLITERTIVKIHDGEKRVIRWRKICREAAMQSRRPGIPTVAEIGRLPDFLSRVEPDPEILLLLPWEESTRSIKEALGANREKKRIIVLIGPEGGFSQKEAESAEKKSFIPVTLGPNILRTETAGIAVLSMIAYENL
jgi:16S rRNA (uracil1498-N3)-methyltransferase